MAKVSLRALNELCNFLHINAIDGQLTESVNQIGKRLNYSGSTIHRALRVLEEKDLISIDRPKNPALASTIILKESHLENNTDTKGKGLIKGIYEDLDLLAKHLDEVYDTIERQRKDIEFYRSLNN